jgi:hypothetical protein
LFPPPPLIFQRSPYAFLTIFLSNILIASVHPRSLSVSDPQVCMGRTTVLYSFNLLFWDRSLDIRV